MGKSWKKWGKSGEQLEKLEKVKKGGESWKSKKGKVGQVVEGNGRVEKGEAGLKGIVWTKCRGRPFWMSENNFRSQFLPFQIDTQLFFFLKIFGQNGRRRPFWIGRQCQLSNSSEIFG